jgi:hypothetical protein
MADNRNSTFHGPLLSDLTVTADGVGKGEYRLTQEQVQNVESILRSGNVGYAYLYPQGREIPEVVVFSLTPENIANFIGQRMGQDTEMTLTDQLDVTVLTTFGGFIDKCPDRGMLQNVLQHLVPIQMGQTRVKEVPTVSMDTMELYSEMLEQAQSEMRMEM